MAKLLYDYWFVQFDFPDENGKPYKSSGGKMVWNEELKREIPDGWEVKPLSDVFSITMGSSPSGASLNKNGEGIEFYQGSTDFDDLYPTERVYTTDPVRFAKAQDVLLSVRAPVGDMNIAMNDCCIGRGLAAIHHNCSLYAWCSMLSLRPYFDIYNGNGTTFGALTSDDFKGKLTVCPQESVLNSFVEKVNPISQELRLLSKETQQLASLRDFLLPMLMNGQVKNICNEEGKINGLMPNRYLLDRNIGIVDCICGDFFLCYAPCDSENFESMPDNLIDKYIAKFSAKGARI